MSSVDLNFDFAGKRVLITGGGRGMGRSMVQLFVELKATVFVLEKDEALLHQLVNNFPSVKGVAVNLLDWDETRKAVEQILPIHHLVNNAGVLGCQRFLDIDKQHIDTIYGVNYHGVLNVGQVVAKGMIDHKIKGTIVNISSVLDTSAIKGYGVYCSTKSAVTMLTKIMALELEEHGIRVNCIRPGLTDTGMLANLTEEDKNKLWEPFLKRMAFFKLLQPVDIAKAVVFLSSPMASQIQGTSLAVDGGYGVQ